MSKDKDTLTLGAIRATSTAVANAMFLHLGLGFMSEVKLLNGRYVQTLCNIIRCCVEGRTVDGTRVRAICVFCIEKKGIGPRTGFPFEKVYIFAVELNGDRVDNLRFEYRRQLTDEGKTTFELVETERDVDSLDS